MVTLVQEVILPGAVEQNGPTDTAKRDEDWEDVPEADDKEEIVEEQKKAGPFSNQFGGF